MSELTSINAVQYTCKSNCIYNEKINTTSSSVNLRSKIKYDMLIL